jgi:hypothetical protein
MFTRYVVFVPAATSRATHHHIDAITVETCDHVTEYVSQIFHHSVHYVAYEDSHAGTKEKMCCFHFLLGSCKSLLVQLVDPCNPQTHTCWLMGSVRTKIFLN